MDSQTKLNKLILPTCGGRLKRLGSSMILRATIFLFICTLTSISYADSSILDFFEDQRRESVTFNKGVTDEEIAEYFEVFLKYQSESLKEFREQTSEERKAFLINYRKAHAESGVKIPTLKGLSKDEILQFEEIAKYKAGEAIRIELAQKRLLSFTNEQYKLILSEAIKLISKYDEYRKKDRLDRVVISEGYPEKLAFLTLESIYLSKSHCELLLQNGIGKDIGYSINQDKDSVWQISSFDHYKSWKSNRIELND